MLKETELIRQAREAIRESMEGTPVYDDTFAELYNFVKWGAPENADFHAAAQVGIVIAFYLAQANECVHVCHHQITKTLGAVFDRMMTIEEIRQRVDG